jgi:CDP-4-dehydro-6-deoxyglucose reductase, E1
MKYKFPLATSTWEINEIDAMQRVISSGNFTMGENVKLFEKKFAEYFGSKYSVMINSGSSAILLMIAALFYTKNNDIKLKRGDVVIVPAVSWSTTYYPLYQYGLKIKFVDIDINTLNYDLDQLKLAVDDNTRMIMAVNLLGNPNDFKKIKEIIDNRNIILLEDNCESMGARFEEKYTGTFGLMGGFSTFFSHHISTMEGGLIVTDNEEIYQILICLRAHGWTRELPKNNFVTGKKSDDFFEEAFKFALPGYNVRPIELEGALGLEQLKRLPKIIFERRKNAQSFRSVLESNPNIIIQKEIGQSSWFGFSLVIKPNSKISRKELIIKLNRLGFECRPIVAGNFAKNEVVKFFDSEIFGALNNAEYIDQNGLFIGNQHYPIDKAISLLGSL